MLDLVKKWLRLQADQHDFDDEVQGLINACLLDLSRRGVRNANEDDALIQQAVKLYSKANFGYSTDQERYRAAYDALANSLALCGDYNTEVK